LNNDKPEHEQFLVCITIQLLTRPMPRTGLG